MDIATRFHPRARAGSYRDMEGKAMPEDSGGESESNLVRRKFQRTTTDPESAFRKPSLPGSATRPPATSATAGEGLAHRPSLSGHQRRSSTLRENVRVPSGPREFPGSPGKQRMNSSNSVTTMAAAPSVTETTPNMAGSLRSRDRRFQKSAAEAAFYNIPGAYNNSQTRLGSFDNARNAGWPTYSNNHHSSGEEETMDSYHTTPAAETPGREASFDFLPSVNFDDFQTTIQNYDGTSPLLSDFPAVDGGRILPKESLDMSRDVNEQRKEAQLQQVQKSEGLSRTQSFRQRLAGGRQASSAQQAAVKDVGQVKSSLRDRRQNSFNQVSSTAASTGPLPTGSTAGTAAKTPRKSVGPGLLTNLVKGNPTQQQSADNVSRPANLSRNTSLSKARRTTIQPSTSAGAESLPRISTLTATTQSRQNKVKSLQPPPLARGESGESVTSTTPSKKGAKEPNKDRAHTPSSSGNRRQSMAPSGRASGLGARTISPTDARRLKRISMMQPPPVPTTYKATSYTPTPGEEMPNPILAAYPGTYPGVSTGSSTQAPQRPPELPRLTQPSPSLIPRKTSSATPTSARESPESRYWPTSAGGGVSLSAKSSYQSLISSSGGLNGNGSSSRLPTPKPRNAGTAQSGSSMAQYGEEGENDELVPPVPAIPKAYESPKDLEHPPFFSSSMKSSQSGFSDVSSPNMDASIGGLPAPRFLPTPRTSLDVPSAAETPRKRSGEFARQGYLGNGTLTNGSTSGANVTVPAPPPTAPPRSVRVQADPSGRKNANLQPLRLPPMNLMPINTRAFQTSGPANLPRPSQELDSRDEFMQFATPEPKRNTKTPSTPMTASKATFFSRKPDEKALRSSSSHYALRDVMGMDEMGNMTTKFYWDTDGSDVENFASHPQGVPIPVSAGGAKSRGTITPFASGSLPKNSGEHVRAVGLRGRPSGEYPSASASGGEDEYNLGGYEGMQSNSSKPRLRAQTNTTINSMKSGLSMEMSAESPSDADAVVKTPTDKKESGGGGLRRKLSLGWRRASSKAANHADHSPQTDSAEKEGKERSRLQKRHQAAATGTNEMPPPKLPASATWSGDVPSLPASSRPSLDTASASAGFGAPHHVRRKSQVPTSVSSVSLVDAAEQQQQQFPPPPLVANGLNTTTTGVKTRALHSEQPQPVVNNSTTAAARASSWGALSASLRSGGGGSGGANAAPTGPRAHKFTPPPTLNAIVKDKDDYAADDDMGKLSRKRKDVDTAARESDDLRKRAVARSPVSAEHVLHNDRSLLVGGSGLNVFERGEIVDYGHDGIYFTGTKSTRKIIGSLTPSPTEGNKNGAAGTGGSNNFGYDDERGDYNIVLGDHLAYRYEVVDVLGKGSFGQVVRCVDHRDGGVVAVKIIRNKKRFHQQALVEVGILGRLREWDPDGAHATLSITSSFYFRSHLCIVTPCLSINLYELIRAHNFTGFPLPLIRRFARQLLACLVLLQSKHIIHCDLKPENILLCDARRADVRVIDFGSSCREEEKVYTYIQSRFYRSPEVILGSSYGLGIDMWSLGCILAELWTGYPLFPGENEQEQLACIMEIFGPPDRHLVERCTRKKLFFDSVGKPRVTVSSKGRRRRPSSKTLQQALKTEDEGFVDFVSRCLRWDPERRLKPSEAIAHPFIMNLPFHHHHPQQRHGIPDEARRAARVRSTAAVPATSSAANGQAVASPGKRVPAAGSSGNAFAAAQASHLTLTPAASRERSRPIIPETPPTAVRYGGGAGIPSATTQGSSPIKAASAANRNPRLSSVAPSGGPAVAGSKRASNGAMLAGGNAGPGGGAGAGVGAGPPRGLSGNLAQLAARESMAAPLPPHVQSSSAASGLRWRG